jgi:hypothetical protein
MTTSSLNFQFCVTIQAPGRSDFIVPSIPPVAAMKNFNE